MATTVVPSRRGASRKFVITGGSRLAGEYPVQGNKNAALPLICAALLARAPVLLRHVPRIDDVDNLLLLIQALGVEVEWQGEELLLDSSNLESNELPAQLVERLRGAVLLLGPLAAAFDRISCAVPGGCPIGRRSFDVHWKVFQAAGYSVDEGLGKIELRRTARVKEPNVYLEESSVTATENALLLFSALGAGTIENPAREPHVFSLIEFLNLMGCEIELHPLYFRILRGLNQEGREIAFDVPPDYADAGDYCHRYRHHRWRCPDPGNQESGNDGHPDGASSVWHRVAVPDRNGSEGRTLGFEESFANHGRTLATVFQPTWLAWPSCWPPRPRDCV